MTEKKEKNCWNCGYRGNNPGNAHPRCTFDWSKSKKQMPKGNPHGIKNGWWSFPLNYDPVWMQGKCEAFSIKAKKGMIKEKHDPLMELMALLG